MKAIGVITANYSTKYPTILSEARPAASMPFLGRYRVVDFALSNMVNCGIRTVGIIMPYNYRSLIDHIGSGREWDLNRKKGGLFVLPGSAFGTSRTGSRFLLRDLVHNKTYLERSSADYVVVTSASFVYNADYRKIIEAHENSGADITVLTKKTEDKENVKVVEKVVEKVVYRPKRERLPKSRQGRTTSFSVSGAEGYIPSGAYEDGRLGEVFLKLGKQGSTLAGVMDAFSIAVSIGLQYGVPLESFVQKFTNLKFEPAGMTDDPDIRIAQSFMDYIFRRLALDYLSFDDRADLGIYTAAERARYVETGSYLSEEEEAEMPEAESLRNDAYDDFNVDGARQPSLIDAHTTAELMESMTGRAVDAPLCMTCGTKMRPSGSCYVCEGCGSTSGCS